MLNMIVQSLKGESLKKTRLHGSRHIFDLQTSNNSRKRLLLTQFCEQFWENETIRCIAFRGEAFAK